MSRHQIMFFGTKEDFAPILSELERSVRLDYTLTGLFSSNIPITYSSFTEIPDFTRATHPTAIANSCYLLAHHGMPIHVRPVPQYTGGVLFAVDQLENPDTVAFRPAARYSDAVILGGMFGTVSQSPESKNLYKLGTKAFRRHFVRHEEFLVGAEAEALWRSGVRLTLAVSSPSQDLPLGR